MMKCITLITDLGSRDGFAGVMKGVLLGRAPRVPVIDLTHEIAPGDIESAAFVLMTAWRHFPRGSVNLVVVDPGVGTSRAPLAIRKEGRFFVGPDNGVLTWACGSRFDAAVELRNRRYRLVPESRTFHGRDIFAPAAAALASGVPLLRLGPRRREVLRLPFPAVSEGRRGRRGEAIAVDRFGNVVTNLDEKLTRSRWGARRLVAVAGGRRIPVVEAYGAVRPGAPLAVFGSAGFLELSVREGRADRGLGLRRGSRVAVEPG